MRIAILEDDAAQAELLAAWIEEDGHGTQIFLSAEDFQRGFSQQSFDLLILDWILPESSGLQVLRWIRRTVEWRIPVLFLTRRDAETDVVQALEAGADDYMAKPVSRAVVLARLHALARRAKLSEDLTRTIEVAEFRINHSEGQLTRFGKPITMTEREFRLAYMLFSNVGRVLSREYLLKVVWGKQPNIATRTVDTHVSRLRQKLGLTPEHGWLLKAVYQHGYRLEQLSKPDVESGAGARSSEASA